MCTNMLLLPRFGNVLETGNVPVGGMSWVGVGGGLSLTINFL